MNDNLTYYINGISGINPQTGSVEELLIRAQSSKKKILQVSDKSQQNSRLTSTDISGLYDFISKRKLRRIDHFSRLSLYAACLVLDDAGLFGMDLSRIGLAVASCYGTTSTNFAFMDSFLNDGDKLASPTHFSSSLHNAAPSYISMLCKTHGPAVTTSNFNLGVPYALLQAMSWLDDNVVDNVIVGGVEEYNPVLAYCLEDKQNAKECLGDYLIDGSFLGEGAACFMLSKNKTEKTYASIRRPAIANKEQLEIGRNQHVVISPKGLLGQEHIYQTIYQNNPTINLSEILGYNPSAMAFCVASAAYSMKNRNAEQVSCIEIGAHNIASIDLGKLG
ncbi:MAG: beta-ketoacyl synthase chain length factor [Desulfotalea sp.]